MRVVQSVYLGVAMPSSKRPTTAVDDKRIRRDMGMIGLLFTSVGSIIGSGWLFGALFAAEEAGPAAILSWIIGAIMITFIGLVYAELGTMLPLSGSVVRYPHFAFGSFSSFTFGWLTWIAGMSTAAIEVEAALQYANSYLPFLQHVVNGVAVLTVPGFFIACALLVVFGIINMLGVRWFSRINAAAVWWKLGVILLTIAAFLAVDFHGVHFVDATHGGFFPLGWHGVFSAIATAGVVFSYLGFRQAVILAGESRNPQRTVPFAVIGSLVVTAAIYVLLQIAFIGALPELTLAHGWANIGLVGLGGGGKELVFGPIAALATSIGLAWLAMLLFVDAFISPADTSLIYVTQGARILYAMGRNRNAPRSLAKVEKRGVPWIGLIVSVICGMIFFLPFPGWKKLVGLVTSATVLSFASGAVIIMVFRRELPDHERPFFLKGGWIIPFLAFWSSNLIVFWSGWDIIWKMMLMNLMGFILLGIYELGWHKHTPKLDFLSGLWMIPWFGGLTLISWLGTFSGVEHVASTGNLGYIDLYWGFVVMAVFSALIMWMAHSLRLRGENLRSKLAEKWGEDDAAAEGV
jgi:amino acid transporter